MARVESYRDLKVWQRGIDITEQVYQVSNRFPAEEKYGLTSQVRRAAVSVPSNIAEGWGRGSKKQYVRFLRIARCSVHEVETQIIIARRLRFTSKPARDEILRETEAESKMLLSLIRSLSA
jgi:four helix bundle protein